MQKFEIQDLTKLILKSNRVNFKEKDNLLSVSEYSLKTNPGQMIELFGTETKYTNFEEYLIDLYKALRLVGAEEVIKNVKRYNDLSRMVRIRQFNLQLLLPNRRNTVFYSSSPQNDEDWHNVCIIKFQSSEGKVYEYVLEPEKIHVTLQKSFTLETDSDNEIKLANKGILSDDDLKNAKITMNSDFTCFKDKRIQGFYKSVDEILKAVDDEIKKLSRRK